MFISSHPRHLYSTVHRNLLFIVELQRYTNLCCTSVHQEDCSQQDAAPDELVQRSADLDDLDDLDLELDQEEDGVVEGMTPAPHYSLSQSRSLSRLSRMDTHRVRDTTSFFQG